MDIGAIFLLLAVTILVGLFITRPFIERHRTATVSAEEQQLSSLLAERDRLFSALQDLDFDNTLGKIPFDDYPVMRSNLMQQAADVLRRLDMFRAKPSPSEKIEERIEAVIAARRADSMKVTEPGSQVSDDEIEAFVAARRSARKEKSGGFCSNCGKPVLGPDRFCPHCGKPIR